MPEINYKKLDAHLAELDNAKKEIAPVYLIYGEEMLVITAYDELLDFFIPAASRDLNYDPIDGAKESIHNVVERLNTYSLLAGIKVVSVKDSKIFYARQDKNRLLENAKTAHENNDLKKAATYFLSVIGHLNLSFDDVGSSDRNKALGLNSGDLTNNAWMDDVITYCQEHHLNIPAPEDDCSVLQAAIEKGFPKNNHLFMTAEFVDKRRGLFKAIVQKGMVIDCSVPKGERRADKMAQEDVLMETMSLILKAANKKMNKAAFQALYEMTGFDLRTFSNNLEKLINYVGDRENITVGDVEAILKRTKKDPIYDLTNAVADRNVQRALFYLNSLLAADFHPLQILAAIANQVRKLLLVKDFAESTHGKGWQAGCPYNQFRNEIMPAILAYDKDLIEQIENWDKMISNAGDLKTEKPAKSSKKKAVTDLLIARNPKNSYPVYQVLIKSERFTKKKLSDALEVLNEVDFLLKSSRQDPKLILEKLLLGICQAGQQGIELRS
jgi:DNA polymerase-3 subunit delta